MPSGLQCWDVNGVQIFDFTDDLIKVLGEYNIGFNYTGSANSGTFTDSRLSMYSGCVPYHQILFANFPSKYMPSINFSGNTISWNYKFGANSLATLPNVTFEYGLI